MKTDASGGSPAGNNVEERLSRQFAGELERAERDYPVLMRPRRDPLRPAPVWQRFAAPMAALIVLVVVSLVGVGIALRPSAGPTGNNPAPAGVVRGSDGIPTSIDGQRVYRIGDKAEWQNLSGSFLLAAYATDFVVTCPTALPQSAAEAALVGQCGGVLLARSAGTDTSKGIYLGDFPAVAPRSSEALAAWLGGQAIVMRVHTHDPEAAQCAANTRAACESAVVVEAVVWPTVPTAINGERVYRGTDQASFPTSGSFLLGGPATKPSVMPACPAPINKTNAEQQLIPYCHCLLIDGLSVAPMSNLDEPNGEIVVARVHIYDPLAAQCPATTSAQCKASIVVEAVVWRSSQSTTTATATPASSMTTPVNPDSSASVGTGTGSSSSAGPSIPVATPPAPPAPSGPLAS